MDEGTVRTVLVYMVANNSLGRYYFDEADLEEMRKGAVDGKLGNSRWLVYHHPYGEAPRLKELMEDGTFVTLREYSEGSQSVTIDRMKEVMDDTRFLAPAKDYGLVLWSHATGWLQNGVTESRSKLRAFGDDGGRYMNITSLAQALEGQNLSFIYADCCYMGCVEVAYQLRDCARYFVASAAELPAAGMNYSVNMECLTGQNLDLIGSARNTYEMYAKDNSTRPNQSWCTMSVVDLSMMDELSNITAEVYRTGEFPHSLNPQTFTAGVNYYSDLAQFVENVTPDNTLLSRWNNIFSKTVLYEAATPYIIGGVEVHTHCGLTTFILNSTTDSDTRNYRQLDWYADVARFQPLP
ncbi:MAG: hypothetical protein K2M07_02505 [Muribaculaceae bacterium]|nr:hypothetical protein [Muribaculaceae bacterium]